jgi:hypothetical protein
LAGSTPFLGSRDQIEQIEEFKVEMVCEKEKIEPVLQALVVAHPYEEPAYHAVETLTMNDLKPNYYEN